MEFVEDPCCVFDGSVFPSGSFRKNAKTKQQQLQHHHQEQQQQKRQVRRRLHTSRPYQERLLNMAEARREIVTALKFHRAAMKQASEEQQQNQQQQQQQESSVVSLLQHSSTVSGFEQQDLRFKSRRNPRIYPSSSCTTNFTNEFSYSSFSHPSLSVPTTFNYTSFSVSPPLLPENPNFTLPNHTLGLNLNLHDFNNLDATFLLNNNNSSPTSSTPPLSFVTDQDQEFPSIGKSQEGVSSMVDTIESSTTTQINGAGYHIAMDDEGMEEMRSIGEQYQMEWNDTMNLVTSALWFNFLKNLEHDAQPLVKATHEDEAYELIEFPAWLNAKESCLEQFSEDYFQDPHFPWSY